MRTKTSRYLLAIAASWATTGWALFLDGKGHYGIRGEFQSAQDAGGPVGQHQGFEQSFGLGIEMSLGKSSFFGGVRLFDNLRDNYLGDTPAKDHQDTIHPSYKPYIPKITSAYMQYPFDFFIFEAGRRPRDWGLGIFMDSGKKPFSSEASIYDGVALHINIQKFQTISFTAGYDKLAETGTIIGDKKDIALGPQNRHDDTDQYYFNIELDDRKKESSDSLKKQIGIYGAKLKSADLEKGGSSTDSFYLDVYAKLYLGQLLLAGEGVYLQGSSADPNLQTLGGAKYTEGKEAINKISSMGFYLNADWVLSQSGSVSGPEEYNRGTKEGHILFAKYAYAPGDADGYYNDTTNSNSDIDISKRKAQAQAMRFHRNFSPTLILFNGHNKLSPMHVDGVFDSSAFMNAQLVAGGYRFESFKIGDIETQVAWSFLQAGPSQDVKNYYASKDKKPVGYYGNSLGIEADIKYRYKISNEAELGLNLGALFAGDAWKVSDSQKVGNNYLVSAQVVTYF